MHITKPGGAAVFSESHSKKNPEHSTMPGLTRGRIRVDLGEFAIRKPNSVTQEAEASGGSERPYLDLMPSQ